MKINIAAVMPEEVVRAAVEVSKNIGAKNEAFFILDGENFIPHITIYPTRYAPEKVDQVLETVGEIAESHKAFTVKFEKVRSHLGYMDAAVVKSEDWIRLHEMVVNLLSPLRDQKFPQYGEIFEMFVPHLTFTRLADEERAIKISKNLNFSNKEFRVTKIAAYVEGENGTCNELIKEFTLKKL